MKFKILIIEDDEGFVESLKGAVNIAMEDNKNDFDIEYAKSLSEVIDFVKTSYYISFSVTIQHPTQTGT